MTTTHDGPGLPAIERWIAGYGRAWEQGDDEGAAALFTDGAAYRSHPFREPFVGHEAIRGYWRRAAGAQDDVEVRFGRPVAAGRYAAVEWWATLRDPDDGEVTIPGCLVLRFAADGRCEELREYWHLHSGRQAPYPEWGA